METNSRSLKWMVLVFILATFVSCGGGGGGGGTGGGDVGGGGGTGSNDSTPPSVPTGLTLTVANQQKTAVNLTWTASTDNVAVLGYRIYRNGVYLKLNGSTSASDSGLALDTEYCYTVSAFDAASNESGQSSQLCLDRVPPSVPVMISATAVSPSQIDLLWSAATDTGSGLAGYKLYSGGTLIKSIPTTTGSNGGLTQNTSRCYTVSAYDNHGNESAQSTQSCATTLAWQFEYVTRSTTSTNPSSMDNGDNSSIAIDNLDHLHAIYQDDNGWPTIALKYAFSDTISSWTVTTIASSSLWQWVEASIAVDSNNKVHICYYDDFATALKYVTNTSGSFAAPVTIAAAAGSDIGSFNSIAVDKNNKVHISYWDKTHAKLMYATNALGSWTTTTIDDTGGAAPVTSSIAVDSQGNVHISYVGEPPTFIDDNLKYATNASGAWVTIYVDENHSTNNTSIAVDSNGKAHIAYYDWWADSLKYASNVSGQWVYTTVDYGSYVGYPQGYPSIKIDRNDKAHISYQDPNGPALKYATNASGEWKASSVDGSPDSSNVGYSSSLVIDSNNKVHISTYDVLNLGMKHEYY